MREVSEETRQWLADVLTAEEIVRWGQVTVRALGVLIDGLNGEEQ